MELARYIVLNPVRAAMVRSARRFVAAGNNQPSPWQSLKNQVFLGSEQFVDQMQKQIEGADRSSEIPSSQRRSLAKPLAHYFDQFAARNETIVQAYLSGGYSMKEIGEYIGLHYSRVSRIIREGKRQDLTP